MQASFKGQYFKNWPAFKNHIGLCA